jgi:hypothetical protein
MRSAPIPILASMLLAAPAAAVESRAGSPILLDNRCDEAEWKDAASEPVQEGVRLRLKHDARFAYLCIEVPEGSFATIDFYLQPADGSTPWNLHASAQLGEKQRGAGGWPQDWTWGNQRDWYSPAVPFRGVEKVEGGVRPQFGSIHGRELQISRARFAGDWRFMFETRALGAKLDGSAVYPAGASVDDATGWATLAFAD